VSQLFTIADSRNGIRLAVDRLARVRHVIPMLKCYLGEDYSDTFENLFHDSLFFVALCDIYRDAAVALVCLQMKMLRGFQLVSLVRTC
jgi:hypothetical protein